MFLCPLMVESVYMMQFGGHDFGKNIYLTNGSHGCINSPPILAQTIFDNIETGTPVICYLQ